MIVCVGSMFRCAPLAHPEGELSQNAPQAVPASDLVGEVDRDCRTAAAARGPGHGDHFRVLRREDELHGEAIEGRLEIDGLDRQVNDLGCPRRHDPDDSTARAAVQGCLRRPGPEAASRASTRRGGLIRRVHASYPRTKSADASPTGFFSAWPLRLLTSGHSASSLAEQFISSRLTQGSR